MICFCIKGNILAGAGRVVSDMARNALVCDLVVAKSERNQGIGTKIMKKIINECRKLKIGNICLVTDPRYSWLVKYYQRLGFKVLKNGKHMVYKSK